MRLSLALNTAFALGLMSQNCSAFSPPLLVLRKQQQQQSQQLHSISDSSWDNDDFLDALSNPPEEPQGTMPEVTPQTDEKDSSQGGSRFQAMMAAAKAAKAAGVVPEQRESLGPPPMNPFAGKIPGVDDTTTPANNSPTSTTPNLETMSVEDQAAMFRAMMAQGGGAPAPPAAAPTTTSKYQEHGKDDKGRKVGRNRDADTIANTSDVYFAQLKRDSSVRNMARINGEDDVADQIFEDDGVKQLKEEFKKNPYIQRYVRLRDMKNVYV